MRERESHADEVSEEGIREEYSRSLWSPGGREAHGLVVTLNIQPRLSAGGLPIVHML